MKILHLKQVNIIFYFSDKNFVEFYDPFGKSINNSGKEFSELADEFADAYKFCKVQTQPLQSNLC